MKKIIYIIGVLITGLVFWLGAGTPKLSAEDAAKIINVLIDNIASEVVKDDE